MAKIVKKDEEKKEEVTPAVSDQNGQSKVEELSEQELSELLPLKIAPPEGTPMIYPAMVNVMGGIKAIVKKKGGGVNYAFRSIDEVMNTVHPVLQENGVFLMPIIESVENKVLDRYKDGKVIGSSYQSHIISRYRFYAVDGSYVEGSMAAESIDYSDKATQQALSYCYKNIILQAFCIPTEDVIPEGDAKQPDRTDENPRVGQSPAGKALQDTKLPPRQKPPEQKPTAEQEGIGIERMPEAGWNAMDSHLAQFKLTDNARQTWIIVTLRENGLKVPSHLVNVSRNDGKVLFAVAKYSAETGTLVNKIPDAPAEAPAPPATEPPAEDPDFPTHTGGKDTAE